MWKQLVKDYLCFSKSERRAVLLLLALILVIFVAPYWWPMPQPAPPDKAALNQLQRQMEQWRQANNHGRGQNKFSSNNATATAMVAAAHAGEQPGALFYFDPNSLSAEGWRQLGLHDKTIQTILHYREKGGRFRRAEDIGRIYGLYSDQYARLLPFVRIAAAAAKTTPAGIPIDGTAAGTNGFHYPRAVKPALSVIEINQADTNAFIALPGIGGRLANRIVHFREKLGGFYSVEQIGETYALPDSTFRLIKQWLQCDSSAVHKININTADAGALRQHPYIRWNIANAIVAWRQQHGDFATVEDLLRIDVITADVFRKLRPYLCVR